MKSRGFIAVALVLAAMVVYTSAYVVDETEQVVITRFGKLIGVAKTESGLYFKVPIVDQANYFPKNLQQWEGDPGQIPTLDKTYIWVDAFARWKIVDPVAFFQTVNNLISAQARLDDIIDPAVRNAITKNRLIETVRWTNRELDTYEIGLEDIEKTPKPTIDIGREQITLDILKASQPKLAPFGIELVDVKLKRINYVEEVRESVYGRMIAERKQIAEKFRSEGQGEARKIQGEKERELKLITSEAYREAQQIKGTAEAEAIQLYAEAFGKDPEFYSFVKTLETYSETFNADSTIVLSTDSEFLKYMKTYMGN